MRPFVAVPCRLIQENPSQPAIAGIRLPYLESIVQAGGIPIAIPHVVADANLKTLYDLCDGLLLTGGEDVHPKYYNEEPSPKLRETCEKRDELETTLTRWAVADNKPILGICRGCQVLNISLGGTLYQDIDDEVTHAEECHMYFDDINSWETHAHQINIEDGSLLKEVLHNNKLSVNSIHHQALKQVAPQLKVSATSTDGIIEAVEARDGRFILGVQFHPETMWQNLDSQVFALFRSFVEACWKNKQINLNK